MSDRLNGREYWRSFEQRAGSAESAKHIENEFPGYDPNEIVSMPRRRFLKLTAASMAVAGVTLTGCRRWPREHIVPSTAGLRDQLPGVPEFYATALERNGVASSLLVTSYDGRPIKIEGNPTHPLFATWWDKSGKPIAAASDAYAQASVLELYDPARSRLVVSASNTPKPKAVAWDAFLSAFEQLAQGSNGINLAVLCEVSSGLSHAAAKKAFLARFPSAQWVEYEPFARDAEIDAATASFGKPVRAVYHLEKARTIVSLDADLLGADANSIRHSSDWAKNRRSADGAAKSMNRLYVAESTFSSTGTAADHRLPLKPSQLTSVAAALAAAIGVSGALAPEGLTEKQKQWIAAAATDLKAGNAVVAVGPHVSAQVQSLVYAMNFAIGAVGAGVTYHELPGAKSQIGDLRNLCDRMTADQLAGLLILGGNPVYNAPADLDFASALKHVRMSAHLSLYADETSLACNWQLPRSHYLESWGDARAWDGSVLLQQPLIMPLYDTRSPIELVATLAKSKATDGQTLVHDAVATIAKDDVAWRTALHDGFVKDSAFEIAKLAAPTSVSAAVGGGGGGEFELRFVESAVYDGRYANNGWLQEAPDPITKLVWDNAALMNKTDADKLGVEPDDLITITLGKGHTIDIPVYVLWGQPKGVITLPLGYGRTAAGPIGGDVLGDDPTDPVGFDTYKIRKSGQMFVATGGVEVTKTGGTHELVSTQEHQQLDFIGVKGLVYRTGAKGKSGSVIRETSLAEYVAEPDFVDHVVHRLPLLQLWDAPYPSLEKQTEIAAKDPKAPREFNVPHAWGMTIDMSSCVGCNACVVACQAENNVPTVGKAMVKMNREMHWIRLDRYFKAALNADRTVANDDYENVEITYQVMMCVHCENAPCEQVCPVAATVHDTEGLNTMVYNRCIGTRYCANNCPYKVRRFNYMDWHSRNSRKGAGLELVASAWAGIPDTQQQQTIEQVRRMVYNPEVTVRMRGVMEKCTYCTQRIKAATINRKNEWAKGRLPQGEKPNGQPSYTVDDFEILTACQQACSTQAITFGNLMDRDATVRAQHALPRAYTVLEDLNTRARTKHLAKIRNRSDQLAEASPAGAEQHGLTGNGSL